MSISSTSELAWFKSSYSGSQGDDCIEVALDWRKSSYSSGSSGDCVEVAQSWRKSTHSGSSGDDCVEVAQSWRKSTHSSGSEGDCVEICSCPATIHVRDSKNSQGPQLALDPRAWGEFIKHTANR
ncbi:DUF397 domain-containing protein [Streptomyces sp. NRRL S-1521]|uniref:DUF397 domain-containing protein n=1 Tax=Streptomyces sp. NRRL S-1521 TaxID=1609100 RepID=UPI00074A882F|nr:DUF397 domain-containing protein [Streptomyces sp. NRRL S-1521]KUL54380.1 toxin-antitoxin system toxin subunit [Streptomyces sp. NRRL S-1521]